MKYALNHPWKFNSWSNAFMIGFLQIVVLFGVEAVNLAILLTNQSIMETIMNFLALVIISDFAEYFFLTVSNEKLSICITEGRVEIDDFWLTLEELTKIEMTTSDQARFPINENKLSTTLKDYYDEQDRKDSKNKVENINVKPFKDDDRKS